MELSAGACWASPTALSRAFSNARARPLLDALGGWRALETALGALWPQLRGAADAQVAAAVMFQAAFLDRTNLMLLGAGFVSLVLGVSAGNHASTDWVEGTCVLVAVSAIVFVTAMTELKKERQFQELNAVKNNPLIHVVRDDGTAMETPKWELVVGDVVVLHTGDIVPADGVLLSSQELRVDESAMTGEAEPVSKHWQSDKRNVVLGGTTVMEGSGTMVALCVGDHTQEGLVLSVVHGTKTMKKEKKRNATEQARADQDDGGYVAVATPGGAPPDALSVEEPDSVQSEEAQALDRTPLALKLERLNLTMGKIGAVISTLLFFALCVKYSIQEFAVHDKSWSSQALSDYVKFFILAVTTLVVAIPEGLPLAVIIALTYSVRQMLNEKSLVRHLYACETAGNATIICSDKTGTLTTNEMTVTSLWLCEQREEIATGADLGSHVHVAQTIQLVMQNMAINSSAELLAGDANAATGSPTESALLRFARDAGWDYNDLRSQSEVVRVVPFSSDRKCMTTVINAPGGLKKLVLTKGAPEGVLMRCESWRRPLSDGAVATTTLTDEDKASILLTVVERHAARGCRTLCLAYKELSSDASVDSTEIETSLTLLGIVAIEDPIRPEVPHAIAMCQSAGVAVCIVTGDNILTATSIARQCGILNTDDGELEDGQVRAMDAAEFRARVTNENGGVKQEEFDAVWPTLRVLARATPLDKYVLVSGLMATQQNPQLVAVTGDGTNDAAALKKAHVGFAMGEGGTEVAKRASDIVVLDDNFLSIVNAIKWGRNVYDSIAKFLQFQLTMILVAVAMAAGSALFMDSPALTAVQILWINLFMDAFVSLGLATEAPTDRVMKRKPYRLDSPLLSLKMRKHIVGQCVLQLLVLIVRAGLDWPMRTADPAAAAFADSSDPPNERSTMVFNTFAWMQLFNQINCRRIDDELNVLAGLAQNKLFVGGWVLQALLQWAAVQYGGTLFHCVALSVEQWGVCVGLAALTLPWGFVLRVVRIGE